MRRLTTAGLLVFTALTAHGAYLVELDGVDFSVCAHGRPVAIRVGTDELERRFHRA